MISQLVSQMSAFSRPVPGDNALLQLGRFVLGGLGWVLLACGISVYLVLYLVWYVLAGSSK